MRQLLLLLLLLADGEAAVRVFGGRVGRLEQGK
jgi:hypothetical protein